MKVPFVNYPLQYRNIEKEIDKAIKKVLLGGDLILRSDVEKFEEKLAKFVGVKYAVSLNSGTDALFFSLKAAGIKPGDEVITVSHTFVACISTIIHCGAVPVLVDISDDFLMNVKEIEKKITKKTKAIIPVHINGRCCDIETIIAIAKKHNLVVIEDSAQALGAKFNGKMAGSFGLTGCFSFYPAKILGCFGDGGALITNDSKIAEKARLLRDHGQKTKTKILCYGWNSRLDNLQAAVLNVKLKYLPKYIKRRREIAEIYNKELSKVSRIILPLAPNSDFKYFDIYQNYVIRVQKRNKLFDYLKKEGIETLIKDPVPNHWQKGLNLKKFRLPNSERFAKEIISLPMYPELTNQQINYVIKTVKCFYEK